MANQRSKDKSQFTATTEIELKKAIETYAEEHDLDRNSGLRELLYEVLERKRLLTIPDKFRQEIAETKSKNRAKRIGKKK